MEAIMMYVGVSAACLSICYVGFLAIQHREMKLRHLRGYLLATMVIALLSPLSNARIQLPALQKEKEVAIREVVNDAGVTGSLQSKLIEFGDNRVRLKWPIVLTWLYVVVAAFLLMRILFHSAVLFLLYFTSLKKHEGNFTLVIDRKIKSPFSFFNWIFLSETYLEKKDILAHEKIHASQYHSLDILLMELLSAVMWFNPLVWMMRKSVQLVHEYLADEGVLRTGIDRLQYQALLVNQVAEGNVICLSSGFHHSLIKKRLIMMTKNKPDHDPKLRILTIIPIAIFLFLGIACLNGQNASEQKATPKEVAKSTAKKVVVQTQKNSEDQNKQTKPFYILNDKHISKESFMALNPNDIESITIIRNPLFEEDKGKTINYLKEKGLLDTYISGKYKAVMMITLKSDKKPEKEKFWGWISEEAYTGIILKERFFVVSNNKHLTKDQYLSIQPSQIDSIQLQGGVQTEQDKERVRNYLIDNGLYEEFKAGKYAALMVVVLKKGL